MLWHEKETKFISGHFMLQTNKLITMLQKCSMRVQWETITWGNYLIMRIIIWKTKNKSIENNKVGKWWVGEAGR